MYIPSLIVQIFAKTYNSSNSLLVDLTRLEVYIILFIIFLIIFNKELRESLPRFFKNLKTNLKAVFKNWGCSYLFMIICNICIVSIVGGISSNEAANRSLMIATPISSIVSVCLIGPICEELCFRANFKKIISNKFLFCLITGLIFGSAHLISSIKTGNWQELLYIVSFSGLGFFFAKAYYETDNIYTSITIHILHNSVTLSLLYLATYLETLI